jgi:mycothiol synthase
MTEKPEHSLQTHKFPGIQFRHFLGQGDFPGMLAVNLASAQADQIEQTITVEQMAERYLKLTNCDPFQDLLIVEFGEEIIGYERGWWRDEAGTGRIFETVGFMAPTWRRKGIGSAMHTWMEGRLQDVASEHPADQSRYFQASASQHEHGKMILLERLGYQPIRYYYEMVRPTLEDIPQVPLPPGLEIRPVLPEHYRQIWAACDETSQDEWGYSPPTEDDYQSWTHDPVHFQPHLWQIVWDTAHQQVAGHCLTFIDHENNTKYNRKRGYTEGIGVGKTWRRRGLARAMIVRSLQALKSAGMTESALNADSENMSTRLYEDCGFQIVRKDAIYRKKF